MKPTRRACATCGSIPDNRLVAGTLEAQWGEKLRALAQVKEQCEQQQRLDSAQLSQEQKTRILSLACEFPRLWRDPVRCEAAHSSEVEDLGHWLPLG
jgi:hypothetical protein